ncbi:MAG: hypothetical protein ACRC6H_03615 [Culicoidibacterales bacterium]
MHHNQRGFILIYLLVLVLLVSSSLLQVVSRYERAYRSEQVIDQPFQELLEKSLLKTSKNDEKCYNEA